MEKIWLQHYDEGVPHTIDYPEVSLPDLLTQTASRFPDRPALIYFDRKITYAQLDRLVSQFAATLQGLGVKKGDRVMLLLPNVPQFVIGFYGAQRAGAITVPTNPQYVPRELEHQANDSGAETIVTLSLFYSRVQDIRPHTKLKHVIVTNLKEYFPPHIKLLFTLLKEKKSGHRVDISGQPNTYWFQNLIKAHSPADFRPVDISPDDVANLGYTGGTTGVPKGAMLTHRNLVCNTLQTASWVPNTHPGEEAIMGTLPFFHSYGMTTVMNFGVYVGAAMILIPDPRDLEMVLKNINKHHPTLFPGVPTMYVAINNYPDIARYDVSSIRACLSGAAPLPPEVQEQFESLTGGKLVEGYGLTESSPVTHANPLFGRRKVGTIGVPVPDTDARIVDLETGESLPPGETGEIALKGPQVMKGYWQRPDETAEVLREGWLYTGDIARMDEDGFFRIVDRKKDMIIASGYNVYPREVEDVLYEHSKILEAAVAGVPHPYRGETVKAFVVLKPGQSATEEEIIEFCRGRLAPYKAPKEVEFRDQLPKTMVGKVLRRVLVEEEKARIAREQGV